MTQSIPGRIKKLVKRPVSRIKSWRDLIRDGFTVSQIRLVSALLHSRLADTAAYRKAFHLLENDGIHVTPVHFYSPLPDTREIEHIKLNEKKSELVGINFNIESQFDLLHNAFPVYMEEYNSFPHQKTAALAPYQFYFYNGMYDGLDALVYYCMIRHFKPARIVEVGSGFSTMIAAQAARKNGSTEVICIEPYPPAFLNKDFPGLTQLHAVKIEELELSFFDQLGENDILFIDSSHVVKTGGDVNHLYLEVLPRLKKGVIVHAHDIFLPWEYPDWWITNNLLFWNEQYLLHAFLKFNSHFKVLYANHFMYREHLGEVKKTFPKCPSEQNSTSFWIQKTQD